MSRQAAYYDRDAGIVYITVLPRDRRRRHGRGRTSEDRGWGLIDYEDRDGRQVCGFELWRPEEIFPPDLLAAFPPVTFGRWERVFFSVRRRWGRIKWTLWEKRRYRRWSDSPEGRKAQAELPPPRRWYRGLPGPPGEGDERSDIAWRP